MNTNSHMKKIILCLLSVVFVTTTISAQDVKGVSVDLTLSKDGVVKIFGVPDKYESFDSGDLGLDERFHYGPNVLIFNDSNFIGFVIVDDRWPVLTTAFASGVRVGDSINKIASLSPKPADWIDSDVLYVPFGDYMMFFHTESGRIVKMSFEFTD